MTDGYQHPDVVLAFIPMTLFTAYGVGTAVGARLIATLAAVGVYYLLMVDGLFWHGPAD
ncbi:hypothetical protein [Halorubrum californiense]|uniref:hypothetical protein n=1 Tax=Halorubrum californiense TaxID=416585 RepID=UPI00135F108C|nr:hypothetical protein [Halorubrum californiense]